MLRRIALIAFCSSIFTVAACGNDEELVTSKCKKVCEIKSDHPCADKHTDCLSSCKTIGDDARLKGFKPEECATCQIGLVEYSVSSVKASECWGIQVPQDLASPTCKDACIDPDA